MAEDRLTNRGQVRRHQLAGKSLKRITTMRDIEVIDSELRLLGSLAGLVKQLVN